MYQQVEASKERTFYLVIKILKVNPKRKEIGEFVEANRCLSLSTPREDWYETTPAHKDKQKFFEPKSSTISLSPHPNTFQFQSFTNQPLSEPNMALMADPADGPVGPEGW